MLPRHTKRTETSCLAVMGSVLIQGRARLESLESWGVPLNL